MTTKPKKVGIVRRLSSGYWRLETPSGAWAQVPPDFDGADNVPDWEDTTIPDAYMSDPANRGDEINSWWRMHGEGMLAHARQEVKS